MAKQKIEHPQMLRVFFL